jgi:Domain of unknown function DUF223
MLIFFLFEHQGNTVQASMKPKNAAMFRNRIIEGSVYSIRMFIVVQQREKKYRATPNDNVILFWSTTEVRRMDGLYPSISMQRFYFTDFLDIPARAGINLQLTGLYNN